MKRILLALLAFATAFPLYVWLGLPWHSEVRALARNNPGKTRVMEQREDEAREAGRAPRHVQSWVPLSRVSRHLVHAVLSSEDQKFFGHEGVDWEAIQKSFEEDRKKWRLSRGGSTITQQLAKNLFFTTHKSPVRKLRDVVVARWLENDLGKKRILEIYLNVIEWGDGVYGCQAAAQRYYGVSCAALDATQAAGLAAMIPNPRRINPRVDARRHARAQRRVLWLMAHAGYLSQAGLGAEPPPPEPAEDEDEAPPAEPETPPEAVAPKPAAPEGDAPAASPSLAPAEGTEPAPAPSPEATDAPPSPSPPPPVAL
ncbi:MAG: monofunctional biosynthetic peptidoglycan transglycosylase [bacterium]